MKNYHQIKSLIILISVFIVSVSAPALSQFEANDAIAELSILQDALDGQDINERTIKDVRERSVALRAEALGCVDEIEPQVETLKLEVEALEQINPEVDIEIYERLSDARNRLTKEDAKLKNCSLTVVRSTRIIDLSNKLLNELTTELLSEKGINIFEAIATLPNQISQLPELFLDNALERINSQSLVFLVLFLILGFSFGFFIGDQIKKIQYYDIFKGLNRELILNLRSLFKPFGRVQAPVLFGSLGIAAAVSTTLSVDASESWVVRLALSPLLASLAYVFINLVTGAFSPASIEGENKIKQAKKLKQKLRFLTLILVLSYIVFGPDWLTSDIASEQSFMRIGIVSVLIISMISILNTVTLIFASDGQYGILKFIGYSALGISFLAELSGFHNLSSFVLSGFMITLMSAYILWSLLELNESSIGWVNNTTSVAGVRIRNFFNLTRVTAKSRLAIYQLFFDAVFWIVFITVLFRTWDPTGTVLGTISSYATDGIPMGDIRIIPSNIIAGIIAFAILTAVTGWIKRWIDRRWLKQITSDRGARDALVTIVGYTGFTISLLVGLSIGGVNITGLAVVAGALSVGIGFGLQSIANNFISGIILLFERPIKAGDFVSVGDVEGIVKKISIRATEVETLDNQDMLIPNSELISGRVTNWVLHNPYGRIIIEIGVAYGSDVEKVKEILEEVSSDHDQVITDGRASPPKALFMGFGDSSLDFQLRVRIIDIKKRYDVLSDLNFEINKIFNKEGITIPFPQRDIHIKDESKKK